MLWTLCPFHSLSLSRSGHASFSMDVESRPSSRSLAQATPLLFWTSSPVHIVCVSLWWCPCWIFRVRKRSRNQIMVIRLFRVNCLVETECSTLNNVLIFFTPAVEWLLRHSSMSPPRSPANQLLTNQSTRPARHHCHCHQSTSTPSTPQQSTMGQHSTTKISDHLWNRIATQCRLRHVEL